MGVTGNLGIERRNCRWIQGDRYGSGDGDETNGRISRTAIVGSCDEGVVGPFVSPAQDLGSNGLRLETVPFKPFHLHVLRHQVSPLCRAYQNLDTDYFQVREVPGIPLSPPKRSFLPGIDPNVICSQLHHSDFAQDLYFKELKLKVYKPAPRVERPVSSLEFSTPTIPFAQYDATEPVCDIVW